MVTYTATGHAEPHQANGPTGSLPLQVPLAFIDHHESTGAEGSRGYIGDLGTYHSDLLTYYSDLMAAAGQSYAPERFAAPRVTHTDLLEALLARVGPRADHFDVAVLASAAPDSEPGFPGGYLSQAVPGAGLVFAVSDQGVSAPFTALRLIARMMPEGGDGRALLFLLDQSSVLHDAPVRPQLRVEYDAASVLVLDRSGGLGRIRLDSAVTLAPENVAEHLESRLRTVVASGAPPALLGGYTLDGLLPDAPGRDIECAAPGRPASGLWQLLGTRLPQWLPTGRRVVLADYDEESARLDTCVIDIPARSCQGGPSA